MLTLGKRLFGVNWVQLVSILGVLGLGCVAKYFALGVDDVSISTFVSTSLDSIFEEYEPYNVWLNVLLPILLYMVSCFFLLWLGITNFATLKEEETKIDLILKTLIGIIQMALFGWFLFEGVRLLFYYAAFAAVMFVAIGLIIASLVTREQES